MGCGERTPSIQYIAVTLTSRAMRRYAGSRAYVHHSLSDFAILGVTFCMHNNIRIINNYSFKINIRLYLSRVASTRYNASVAACDLTTASRKSCKTVRLGTPRHAMVSSRGLRFTAKVFAPVCSEKQDYCGTKIEIPVKNRRSERKIQESGGFLQEYAT